MTATAKKRPTVVRSLAPAPSEDELHERARVASLTSLIADLKAAGSVDKDAFALLFKKAQRVLELDDAEVARALQISRPTVGRWARGESAPHALGRKPTLTWLAKQAGHKLAQHT